MSKSEKQQAAEGDLERLERLARLIRAAGHSGSLVPAQWEALRFLARANRFSNAPIVVAQYLGATKGTVSQTIRALVRRGLVTSVERSGDARSVSLVLTPEGRNLLAKDPLLSLETDIEDLGDKTRRRFGKALDELLAGEAKRQDQPRFGTCPSCRFFMPGDDQSACTSFGAKLNEDDMQRLCWRYRSPKDA
ncbi:MarR family winged helix-turn-helix transcriptional regulator [Aestuariivirga litoralis]|uniref:MarR family winged helix-turn-helix transcriptional regulator n=1 Tax=Aestuariivirga litoralis TaxID=2650924 RepID=UPI0018C7F5C5|nr:MarR family winged helix-turn-helix transcriptional regulator [Aestuariivirga litoralis]